MRILLFILMQVAILVVVSIVGTILTRLFGINLSGSSYGSLLVMCAIFGFVGSFVSLYMSKWMCKRAYGVSVIDTPSNAKEQFLFSTIATLSQRAGIKMPEVGIYDSPEVNAFATGASKDNALVAVSSGLLYNMTEDEIKGVLGHEISHISNGDMVTMSLLQGVLNTFVYFFSYIVAMAITQLMNRNSDDESPSAGHSFAFYGINMLMQIIFGILANIILMWFSRYREYRADAGSASLDGKENMIKALSALQRLSPRNNAQDQMEQPLSQKEGQFQALCINGKSNVSELFMSHPPLEKRIEALRNLQTL